MEEDKLKYALPQIAERHVTALEELIDEMTAIVGPLENFILPGGAVGSAHLGCGRHRLPPRRVRTVTTLAREEAIGS